MLIRFSPFVRRLIPCLELNLPKKYPKCATLNVTSFSLLERFLKGFERSRTSDQEEGFKQLFIFGNSACFESKRER